MHDENFAEQNVRKGKAPPYAHRTHRTQFLPLFCSGVVRLAHRKCEVMARYHVQTAYEGFKVQAPKKKNTALQDRRKILSGETAAK